MNARSLASRARQAGFTIVEIMIGMLIGLIGIVVIMQVFAVSEGFKRTATSGTDAQINGGIALYILEREIRNAGFGLNPLLPLGCMTVRIWDSSTGTGRNQLLVPFEIANVGALGLPAPDANTDVLMVAYGSADSAVEAVQVNQLVDATSDFQVYGDREGFRSGDLVVGVQPGAGPGGTAQCTMHELTKVPGAAGNCTQGVPAGGADKLEHGVAAYKNSAIQCTSVVPYRNKAGGVTDAGNVVVARLQFVNGARLVNLGGKVVIKVFAIRGGNLTVCEWIANNCTNAANYEVVANDIVSMRAVYGEDFDGSLTPATINGDGIVDQWSRTAHTTTNQVSRTMAVGVQITARSGLKEKPTSGTTCDATTNFARPDKAMTLDWYDQYKPVVGSLGGAAIDLSATSADWSCYRYKLFQTTVPIRNVIWRP